MNVTVLAAYGSASLLAHMIALLLVAQLSGNKRVRAWRWKLLTWVFVPITIIGLVAASVFFDHQSAASPSVNVGILVGMIVAAPLAKFFANRVAKANEPSEAPKP